MRASVDARRMSHRSASAKPPATAGPLIAATTGLGKLAERAEQADAQLDDALLVGAVAAELARVHAGAEALIRRR